MKKVIFSSIIIAMLLSGITTIFAEAAPQSVIDFGNSTLAGIGSDAAIVKAVKADNATGKSLDQIKAQDAKWKGTPGVADYMKAIMESDCAKRLKEIQGKHQFLSEIFVMDNKGANVAMTDKTSDYWQGDEAKFTKSFNDGKGAVHVSEVKFDDSSQSYLAQISVPVKDGGKVIGAICFGVNIDEFK